MMYDRRKSDAIACTLSADTKRHHHRSRHRPTDALNMKSCFPARRQHLSPFRVLLLASLCLVAVRAKAVEPVQYDVDLRATESHLVRVTMTVSGAKPGTEIQFPAWNCLYQIRDFVKDVQDVQGECESQPVALERVDLNTWRSPHQACSNFTVHYAVFADQDGPFDAMLNNDHAFLNLAMVLFYLPQERRRAAQVAFKLPTGWKLATLLDGDGTEFQAANYDDLVDSPVEAGHFEEFSYPQSFVPPGAAPADAKRATIRLIIDANRADYSPGRIMASAQKITGEETRLMQDLPFRRYTFILHFPRDGSSTGGMEHRDGAVISLAAASLREDQGYLENVMAHEFFHLWNVKRIRPQALEPVDYIHGNDTRDLWFCEGVTNTYAELALLRAELIGRQTFYRGIADAMETLLGRSARHFQSAETSGREAWLEKYSDYNRPARSISYYNKGELLGYLLDLGIRHASHNQAGLDDVMRRLNEYFAERGRFYTMEDLRSIVNQLAPAFDMGQFLAEDVQGMGELDYTKYFGYGGLQVAIRTSDLAVAGFSASRNSGGLLQVDSVDEGGAAQIAGLQPGDILMMANGELLPSGDNPTLPLWRPGQELELQIVRQGESHALTFRVGATQDISVQISEDPQASPEQLRVREGWLTGTTNPASGKP